MKDPNPEITKSQLREVILAYRRTLSLSEYEKRNKKLLKKLRDLIERKAAKSIHVFLPIKRNKEPDINPILEGLLQSGKQIIVSKTDFKTREMRHFYYESGMQLDENSLGIPQPVEGRQAQLGEVDLILVPLVVADKEKNRIGYGGGYYDELLNQTNAFKVGLSLSTPLDELLQADDWDVPLNEVLTGVD